MNNKLFRWTLRTPQGTRHILIMARDRFQAEQLLRQQAPSEATRLMSQQPDVFDVGSVLVIDEQQSGYGMQAYY
jgi:hypothetical protein